MREHAKSESTQPRSETCVVTLYNTVQPSCNLHRMNQQTRRKIVSSLSGGPRHRRRHRAAVPGPRLRLLGRVPPQDRVQGSLLQALPPETSGDFHVYSIHQRVFVIGNSNTGQAGEGLQVRGARVRLRERAERALQAAHAAPQRRVLARVPHLLKGKIHI